jgi:hypothetical protein
MCNIEKCKCIVKGMLLRRMGFNHVIVDISGFSIFRLLEMDLSL